MSKFKVLLGAIALVAGFNLTGTSLAHAQGTSGAAPKNYVQQIAAKLRQMEENTAVITYVGITKPRERFVGLFQGGNRTAVCATVMRPNIFNMSAAWYYLFYFENGKVEGFKQYPSSALQQSLVRCEQPLTEITKLVRTKR